MNIRSRDGGETREAVLGAETAELATGAEQALALSDLERQNRQAEAGLMDAEAASVALAEVGERVLGAENRGLEVYGADESERELGQERAAIFSQERIENEVARESKLTVGENVEQAGAETRRLEREWEAADAYDRATESGQNGQEAQKILLDKNENAAEGAKRMVDGWTSMSVEKCNLSEMEEAYRLGRSKVMKAFGEDLGGRNW